MIIYLFAIAVVIFLQKDRNAHSTKRKTRSNLTTTAGHNLSNLEKQKKTGFRFRIQDSWFKIQGSRDNTYVHSPMRRRLPAAFTAKWTHQMPRGDRWT